MKIKEIHQYAKGKKDISELEGSLMFLLSFIKKGDESHEVFGNNQHFLLLFCLFKMLVSKYSIPLVLSMFFLLAYFIHNVFFFKCLKFKYEISWKKVLKGVTKSRMIQLPTIDVYLFV